MNEPTKFKLNYHSKIKRMQINQVLMKCPTFRFARHCRSRQERQLKAKERSTLERFDRESISARERASLIA
jgi:hypothetical protein